VIGAGGAGLHAAVSGCAGFDATRAEQLAVIRGHRLCLCLPATQPQLACANGGGGAVAADGWNPIVARHHVGGVWHNSNTFSAGRGFEAVTHVKFTR
jgi:hypothetical protein